MFKFRYFFYSYYELKYSLSFIKKHYKFDFDSDKSKQFSCIKASQKRDKLPESL